MPPVTAIACPRSRQKPSGDHLLIGNLTSRRKSWRNGAQLGSQSQDRLHPNDAKTMLFCNLGSTQGLKGDALAASIRCWPDTPSTGRQSGPETLPRHRRGGRPDSGDRGLDPEPLRERFPPVGGPRQTAELQEQGRPGPAGRTGPDSDRSMRLPARRSGKQCAREGRAGRRSGRLNDLGQGGDADRPPQGQRRDVDRP